MPTYEYLCKSCGHRFEAWQHFTDDPLTECPNCGSHIQRVLFPAGIVFKGSGFYKNDSRGSSASATVAPESDESSGGKSEAASTPATASESKPAQAASSDSASTKPAAS